MKLLLVNDDGIHSQALRQLALALAKQHRVTVVAPDREQSAVSHGINLWDPLFVKEVPLGEGIRAYSVTGKPADCTRLGMKNLTEEPVDLVISGPNYGINAGGDLLYSGTVSAALEAAMLHQKAIAVSAPREADMETVIQVFLDLLEQIDLEQDVRQVLNINIPALPRKKIKGVKWAPQGGAQWLDSYEERVAPDGRHYFWPLSQGGPRDPGKDNDYTWLKAGYVSLTPLQMFMTDPEGFSGKEFVL